MSNKKAIKRLKTLQVKLAIRSRGNDIDEDELAEIRLDRWALSAAIKALRKIEADKDCEEKS